jgi:hypothetical protein
MKFPIAYEAAIGDNLDMRMLLMTLMMGASSSFMTPTGYQTVSDPVESRFALSISLSFSHWWREIENKRSRKQKRG